MLTEKDIARVASRFWMTSDAIQDVRGISVKYQIYNKPKSGGGTRPIAAPVKELYRLQRKILDKILTPHVLKNVSSFVHGGMKRRSYVTHARAHRRAAATFVVDLKEAFKHGDASRVRQSLWGVGHPEKELIVELCVHKDLGLPQGAPTSNALFNLICTQLDRTLASQAKMKGYRYTRYVDELIFSSLHPIPSDERWTILRLIEAEEFMVNQKKTKYTEVKNGAMRVTGVSVYDERLSLSKKRIEELRVFLRRAVMDASVTLDVVEGHMSQVRSVYAGKIPKRLQVNYRLAREACLARPKKSA